jgi:hypothetical protein
MDPNAPVREDGFGVRRVVDDVRLGRVERLELAPALCSFACEQAIRARAAHLGSVSDADAWRVLRIERKGGTLAIVSAVPDGVALSDVLAALEFKTLTLSDEELLELAASVVNAVAATHSHMPTRAHGALTPTHIVVRPDGSTILTGAVFAEALRSLERNREALWREFGLALPSSASLARFDQRGDVTQLGAVVLAIAVRRSLTRDEYPRGTNDVVNSVSLSDDSSKTSGLRQWLQDTLQLHGRVVFSTAVDAAEAFAGVIPPTSRGGVTTLALQTALRQLCGAPKIDPLPHLRAS